MNTNGHEHVYEIEKAKIGWRWRPGLRLTNPDLTVWMRWDWALTRRWAEWQIRRWWSPELHDHKNERFVRIPWRPWKKATVA